jgi:hypothetical protein
VTEESVLDLWAAAGLTEVPLPSGFTARIRIPQPKDLIVSGILPTDLVAAVLAYTRAGKSMDTVGEEDPELARQLEASLRSVMASMVRQLRRPSGETWEPVTIDAARLAMLPVEDQAKLEELALSAISGDDERGAGPDALATFRDQPDGNAGRTDGAAVPPAALDAPVRVVGRPARKPRARRAPQRG